MVNVNNSLTNENEVLQLNLDEVIKARDHFGKMLHEVRCENDRLKRENMKYEEQNSLFQDLLRHFVDNV